MNCRRPLAVVFCTFLLCRAAWAQTPVAAPSVDELKKLTVAELMNVNVTSVSKSNERLDRAAAAVTVVRSEDIRRTGVTSLPEALRFVPGVHVARQNSSTWAVSARGFSSTSSEKLLVLNDTRSIYTPLFSGVFWDVQDYLLHDIDRIEVIRGPGATLWGSNAVNGVINITTKTAKDTQGLFAQAAAGNEERVSFAARYGGRLSERTHYRVFASYTDRDATAHGKPSSPDDWQTGHLGFRSDWEASRTDTVTVQGDMYRGEIGQMSPIVNIAGRAGPSGRLRVSTGGGNILGRWTRTTSPRQSFTLRAYYDRTHRDDPSFDDELQTLDVDFHNRFAASGRHDVNWGLTYRFTENRNAGKGIFAVDPIVSHDNILAGFVQDHVRLRESLRLTIGTKLERNDFSGAEVQPSGRIAWDVAPAHLIWGAISRAVRVPTRQERDIAIDVTPPGPVQVRLLGNPDIDPERLVAVEAGYRWQILESASIDAAAFHNRYSGLVALDMSDPFADVTTGGTVIPVRYQNLNSGTAGGFETLVTYAPIPSSRVTASYSYLHLTLQTDGRDLNRETALDGATPRHQFGLRTSVDLHAHVQLDAMFRSLGAIRRLPQISSGESIPGYASLDVRMAWVVSNKLTLSIVGQNLLHGRHAEFGAQGVRGEIERGAYTQLAWGF